MKILAFLFLSALAFGQLPPTPNLGLTNPAPHAEYSGDWYANFAKIDVGVLLKNPFTDQTITSSTFQGLIFNSTRGSIHIWPNDPTFGVPIIRLNSKVSGDAAITWALNGIESFALYHHGGGPVLAISETDVGGNDILGIFAGSLFLGSAAVPSTYVNIGSPLGIRFSGGQDIGDVGLTASPANGYFSASVSAPIVKLSANLTWSAGAGVPSAGTCTAANGGALYSRTDGTATTTLYVCDNSTHTWTAK